MAAEKNPLLFLSHRFAMGEKMRHAKSSAACYKSIMFVQKRV
jgi:hypothetical protein